MSEGRYLVCDSCRARLPLPTTPEMAASWQRLSLGVGNKFRHTCGKCDTTALLKSMEEKGE